MIVPAGGHDSTKGPAHYRRAMLAQMAANLGARVEDDARAPAGLAPKAFKCPVVDETKVLPTPCILAGCADHDAVDVF